MTSGSARPALLVASAFPAWGLRNGYVLRVEALLAELVERWRVTVLAPPAPEHADRPEWASALDRYVDVRLDAVAASVSLAPADQRRLVAAARELTGEDSFDAALLFSGTEPLAWSRADLPPALADRIDCMVLHEWGEGRGGSPRRWLAALREAARWAAHEARVVRRCAATSAVGEADVAVLRRLAPWRRERVHMISNGVVTTDPAPREREAEVPTVAFSGVMNYPPNAQAVIHFVREVWPSILDRVPEARFRVIGRSPLPEVERLGGRSGVEVTGEVPDMRAELARSWVAVAPMVSGTGVKNKILEAWAIARPVVMYRNATNGLGLEVAPHLWVTEGPADMATAVTALLEDAEARAAAGAEAFALADIRSWSAQATLVDRVLRGIATDVDPVG